MLERNIRNAHGEKGIQWLNSLPILIENLSHHWSLTNMESVDNMRWNYVAYAKQDHQSVVLKICSDTTLAKHECSALHHFDGHGAIKVLDYHEAYHAMLLERALPGISLKQQHPNDIDNIILSYVHVATALQSQKPLHANYQHMSQWCEAIDKIQDVRIKIHLVEKAKQIKTQLLNSVTEEYLCHGDLHLENILLNQDNWLAIDPKGIIGETAFELAAFDLINDAELADPTMLPSKIIMRINQLATSAGVDSRRLLAWIYLRIMISAQWFVEDNGDPQRMLDLAEIIYPTVDSYLLKI